MANLITKAFFVSELDLPTNNVNVEPALNLFIAEYEPAFFKGIMGEVMAVRFVDEIASDDMKAIKDTVLAAAACYIYFKYMGNQESLNTGIGVVKLKSENSSHSTGIYKMTSAMRKCKKLYEDFLFKVWKNALYADFDFNASQKFYCSEIKGINSLNI